MDELKERYSKLSGQELVSIVYSESADYREYAIKIAKSILNERGISPFAIRQTPYKILQQAKTSIEQEKTYRQSERNFGKSIIKIGIIIIIYSIIIILISFLIFGHMPSEKWIHYLSLPVAYYIVSKFLWKEKKWIILCEMGALHIENLLFNNITFYA